MPLLRLSCYGGTLFCLARPQCRCTWNGHEGRFRRNTCVVWCRISLGFLLWLKIMVKGQTTSYYATGGGLNKYQLNAADRLTASLFAASELCRYAVWSN